MKTSEWQSRQDWQNVMQNRHGKDWNHACAACRHLMPMGGDLWHCEECLLPSGSLMPWSGDEKACGMFVERA